MHRDLKPQNVIVTPRGEPKVTDFGLATCLQETEGALGATTDGHVMGSPSYMAPEQAQGMRHMIGPRTDVYGLGAILYEALTGRPPYTGGNAMDILLQIIEEDPIDPVQLDRTIDRELAAICMKALEKNPATRYASAAEMAADLRRYQCDEPVLARPDGVATRMRKAVRRNRDLAILAGLAVAFMGVSLVVSITLFMKRSALTAKEGLRTEVRSVASTAAVMFPAEELGKVRAAGDVEKAEFKSLVARLNKLRARNLRIRDVYLLRPSEDGRSFQIVADADSFVRKEQLRPGAPFANGNGTIVSKGLIQSVAEAEPERKRGGRTLSGYAPVLTENGRSIAVIGLDLSAESVNSMMQPVLRTTAEVSGLAAVLFLGLVGRGRRPRLPATEATSRGPGRRVTVYAPAPPKNEPRNNALPPGRRDVFRGRTITANSGQTASTASMSSRFSFRMRSTPILSVMRAPGHPWHAP